MQFCSKNLDSDIQRLWCARDLVHLHGSLGSCEQGGGNYTSVALIIIKNFPFHFFPSHLSILFLTDFVNYSIETTIVMGQNMQMWHSLRCKQINMFTANQLILTFPSNAGMSLFNFSSREFQSILPTTVHACVTKSKLVAKPRGVTMNTECEESLKSSERYASYC